MWCVCKNEVGRDGCVGGCGGFGWCVCKNEVGGRGVLAGVMCLVGVFVRMRWVGWVCWRKIT